MSETEPDGPYIYQPYGMQDAAHWSAERIYAVGGLSHLATVKGLTKAEAGRVMSALTRGVGWLEMKSAPLSGRDILLHLCTGQTGGDGGHKTYLTIVGRWNERKERWDGAGLEGVTPSFWSEIPTAPSHALAQD